MSARPLPPFALIRRPAASLASGCVSLIERQPVDVGRAREQWLAYVAALNSRGWPTVEVAPDDTLPDSVFIEDAIQETTTTTSSVLPGPGKSVCFWCQRMARWAVRTAAISLSRRAMYGRS